MPNLSNIFVYYAQGRYIMIKFNIKQLRSGKDMTQKELSDATGIRLNTLIDIENNKAKTISIEQINSLCEFFRCQPDIIMTYKSDIALFESDHDEWSRIYRMISGEPPRGHSAFNTEESIYKKLTEALLKYSDAVDDLNDRLRKIESEEEKIKDYVGIK